MVGENGKLHDEVDDLSGIGFTFLKPFCIGIPVNYLVSVDPGGEFFAQRGNFFHSIPPWSRLYIEGIKPIGRLRI